MIPNSPLPTESQAKPELAAQLSRYFNLGLEAKIQLAIDVLQDVSLSWDHDKLAAYPDDLPSFDELVVDLRNKLCAIRWNHSASVHGDLCPAGPTLLGTLPLRSEQIDSPEFNYDVSLWASPTNICERRKTSPCDTLCGVYYGSAEDEVTKFCPRHFYEMHFAAGAPYRLTDATEGRRTANDIDAAASLQF